MAKPSRRTFLASLARTAPLAALASQLLPHLALATSPLPKFRLGLVTYLWGKDLSLAELLAACEESHVLGVELRTTHAHGVEPNLTAAQRRDVRQRFADSPVTLVGLGSNERFDAPDPAVARKAIERSKQFLQLSHDLGSSGVKVKGDRFYAGVPREKTLHQVVDALQELGEFAKPLEQEVRLEVHGGFREIPVHHEIISQVDHANVRTCWNSNVADLGGKGLASNFRLIRPFFGQTAHIRALDAPDYPWDELMRLLMASDYDGWVLLEAHGNVEKHEVSGKLRAQVDLFNRLISQSP